MVFYRIIVFWIACLILIPAAQAQEQWLDTLDGYVERRPQYFNRKKARIDSVRALIERASSSPQKLARMDEMFEEYYTFNFDSAMVYVNKGLSLAEATGDDYYVRMFQIHRGLLLATSGYYSQAEQTLLSLHPEEMKGEQLFAYYYSLTWLYNFWNGYCNDKEFAPLYARKRLEYLSRAITVCKPNSAMYYYLMGERSYYVNPNGTDCLHFYKAVVDMVQMDNRLYASSTYALARTYRKQGRTDLYVEYLCKAGMSDMVCPLKENLALQELSLYLYEKDKRYSSRAVRYIYCSMEDAQFYNNRLRMLEISRILPRIVSAYQDQIDERTRMVYYVLAVVSLLALVLGGLTLFAIRQNKKLNLRREEVHEQNEQLEQLNQKLNEANRRLNEANGQLHVSNQQLQSTNDRRETYLRLFLDLSAVYISKLDNVRKLVSRCLKTGKTDDLISKINRVRMQEEEATTFYARFDHAFILLYPDFVSDFNRLLREDAQLKSPAPHALPKDLRIYALMRLGVTSSAEIATLLFYSPQTVYNYKTAMKGRAISRETFEQDVEKLCHTRLAGT